ncbi:MAG: ornithine carbamoyltransferase [Actinomycetes bacterium]|nr:ornithine carbamoyltransferase [Actinomycetes bacterium]
MRCNFQGKDYLAFKDMSPEELAFVTKLALDFKKKWTAREPHEYFRGQVWAALFEKNSTRTRNALERAAADLGIRLVYLRPDEMQMTRGEPLKDTARILDRYFDGLFIRTFGHEIVEECAAWMRHPVINGLTSLAHPTQGIADIMTIQEKKGDCRGLKLCYAGNLYNVAYTTMIACASFGIHMDLACPTELVPNADLWDETQRRAAVSGARIRLIQDFDQALAGADIVYGMSHYSMGQSDEEVSHLKAIFAPYQITTEAMAKAKPDALFMHCLPAHRGEEVTDEVMESPQSVIFDEGENRMHAIKAILSVVAVS